MIAAHRESVRAQGLGQRGGFMATASLAGCFGQVARGFQHSRGQNESESGAADSVQAGGEEIRNQYVESHPLAHFVG